MRSSGHLGNPYTVCSAVLTVYPTGTWTRSATLWLEWFPDTIPGSAQGIVMVDNYGTQNEKWSSYRRGDTEYSVQRQE
jgi:hypothetical protein